MKTKDLVRNALMAALLLGLQLALAPIPNVELISLFLILYTLIYGRQVWMTLFVFLILEGIIHGFGLWWFSYLYVWPLLCLVSSAMPGQAGTLAWALLSCGFGLSFGLLCSVSYFFTGGLGAALSWWIAGIPFDIAHGAGNFFLTLLLFQPLHKTMSMLKKAGY